MKKNRKTLLAIILSIFILLISQIFSELIASGLHAITIPIYICNIVAGILYVIFCYIFLKILCEKYLKSNMKEYYIPKFKISFKWMIIGFILPLSIIGIYLLFPGTFISSTIDLSNKLDLVTAGIFFTGIGSGIVEEMVFRGMIMNLLTKKFSKKIGIVLPSILFGFVHILGMNFNVISCCLVLLSGTMVGIMFSLIAHEKKSIWNSSIVHVLWNIMIIGGFLHIGNFTSEYSIYNYQLNTKSFMVTGGEFGIESSILSLVGYILVSLITYFMITSKKKSNIQK